MIFREFLRFANGQRRRPPFSKRATDAINLKFLLFVSKTILSTEATFY